jgi:hypothetical protein
MGRFVQPPGTRGSLKWIQSAVNSRPDLLNRAIFSEINNCRPIEWLSPLTTDEYAEYRDAAFLERIGHPELASKLSEFWPARGPQWDALAQSDCGDVFLIEAKAHINEMCSPATQASEPSKQKIEAALNAAAIECGAQPHAPWSAVFYQLGNRLAHLHFLRREGVSAWLLLVNFVGDEDMEGPKTQAEWEAAYRVAYHVMDIRAGSRLMRFVRHLYPDIKDVT